jgi:trigger factor
MATEEKLKTEAAEEAVDSKAQAEAEAPAEDSKSGTSAKAAEEQTKDNEKEAENNSGEEKGDAKAKDDDSLLTTFTVEVPRSKIESQFEEAVEKYAGELKIPGFRKGKVPQDVIRSRFKDAIKEEVINEAVQEAVRDKIDKDKLRIISQPSITDVKYEDGKDLTAEVQVNVFPTITLPDFDSLEVEVPKDDLKAEPYDEQKQIDAILENNRRQVPVVSREIQDGDYVNLKFQSKILQTKRMTPRKNFGFQMAESSESEITDLYKDLIGKKLEESFTLTRKYPEDYKKKPWAGKDLEHYITVESIFEYQKPELNGDFLKTIGFEDEKSFKEKLKEEYDSFSSKQLEDKKLGKIIEKVCDAVDFKVPDDMVNHEVSHMLQHSPPRMDLSKEEDAKAYVDDMKARAERSVKFSFISEVIKEEHKIDITSEDLEAEYKKIADSHNVPVKDVRKVYMRKENSDQLKESLIKNKVTDFLKDKVKIKEV